MSDVTALGSDEGVRAVYRAHGSELYRFALRSLGDQGLADAQSACVESDVPGTSGAKNVKGSSKITAGCPLRTAAMKASVTWIDRLNRRNCPGCCLAATNSSMSG